MIAVLVCVQIVIWIVNRINLMGGNAVPYGIGYICYNAVVGMMLSTMYTFIPDASDYGEYLAGTPVPGAINSVASFANKIALGVSAGLISLTLGFTGFNADLGMAQTPETLNGLINTLTFGNIIFFVVVFVGLFLISRISSAKIAEVRAILDERHAAEAANK